MVASYTPTTGAGGTTATSTAAFPGSAEQQITTFSGLTKQQLNLPVTVDTVGPAPGGQQATMRMTVSQAISAYLAMSPDQQQAMANRLWQSGSFDASLYRAAATRGQAPTIRPIDIEYAYARSLVGAASAGESLDDFLSTQAQISSQTLGDVGNLPSGAGGPGSGRVGIHGGGQRFVIDLANPDDVAFVAQNVFQSGLHRNANDQELNAIVAHMQSQEFADSSAKNLSSEAQSYQDFLARQESRDIFQGGPSTSGSSGTAPAPGSGTPATLVSATSGDATQIITQVAQQVGVDPQLAIAIAQHESNLNPGAVGDKGTSFGLYQLHQGGELGNLTPQQAFDPATNARVALTQVAAVVKAHPDWSPGQIAAAAQRPADPAGYAAAVNGLMGQPGGATQPMTFSAPGQDSPHDVYVPSSTTVLTPTADASASAYAYMRSQDATEYTENQYSDQAANMAKALAALGQHSAAAPSAATGA